MRVALVVPDLMPRSGGPARNVPALAEALGEQGIDVEVHAIGPTPAPRSPHVTYRPARGLSPHRLGRSPELMADLFASSAQLIHAHCLWMLPLGYASRAARSKRIPLIISPRGMLAPWSLRRSRLKKTLAARLVHPGAFRMAAAWHATSTQEAADIRALGHDQPVFIIPNGVDTEPDSHGAVAHYRERAPEMQHRRILLFYSRFHAKKRILELMADFASIAKRRSDWHLLVVGIPEQYSVPQLRAEAKRLGISDRTSVLDGLEAPKPYPVAELMALPTHDENFGQVVAEALAAGVPVITTSGTPWQGLDERGAGRCVGLERFAAELEALMGRSPAELKEMGDRGRQWARTTLDWRVIARQMADAYRRILEQGSERPR
jgi:glycosyltransferase involved in cell wall biosynthesis